ncbi:MAG TPA: fumarylacetoacetate hydrolase family protein [Frankiaceae bacterium]|nr:fumarylacetoacetate hydrolase family protein [Frankiaceae bacterium]
MRWCSWTSDELGGTGRLGALRDRDGEPWLLDVASWAASREATAPTDLVDLVEASEATQRRITELAASAGPDAPGWLRPSSVRMLAPLRAPNSLRDFLAFRDHVERGAARRGTAVPEPWDRLPVYYKGNRRSISGDGEDVRWPSYTERLDYECEVAAVVGRAGRDLSEDEARESIFGYLVMNDWSARDIQRDEMACWLGPAKAKDFNTSFGPVLVTADEWDPEDDHEMTVTVDGEVWSRGTTAGRRWTFGQMLAHVSRDEDVYPTDVLGSGTFGGGCGLDLDRWLRPGQTVTLSVEGLGTLTNTVVR